MQFHRLARGLACLIGTAGLVWVPTSLVFAADCTPNPTGVNATVTGGCSLAAATLFTVSTGSTLTATNTTTLTNSWTVANAPSLLNNGTITSVNTPGTGTMAFYNSGTLTSLVNNGVISAPSYYVFANQGTITSLLNTGSMTGSSGITNYGTIGTLTNTGTMSSIRGDFMGRGSISTLNNLQGAGNPAGAFSLVYKAPASYNLIAYSPSSYGQLAVSNVWNPGTLAFNVYGNTGTTLVNGVSASVLSAGTYAGVLQGFSTLSNVTGTSGTYGNFAYSLVAGSQTGYWDLVVTATSTNMLSRNTYLSSNLGSSVNPVFAGGTLRVANAGQITRALSMQNSGGTIDQNGLASIFTGDITHAIGETQGRLIITNSGAAGQGSVTLSGVNTFTGGTEVQAGAVLQIASADALGSGQLDLIGSATVPATLAVTSSTTIHNRITVAGDPVFNIAPGTTTTVNGVIADGSMAGDVVLNGGGTLALTAANTYSGPTTIDAGTLALIGSGSISASTAVTNNASLDVTQATGNVALGGSYAQSANGTLKMTMAPVANQQVNVVGTASLGGTLSLAAAAGTYRAGRYTLMTSAGLGGSTFSALTTNLASVTDYSYRLAYDANDVYLDLRSSAADTMGSIQALGADLNKVYNAQYGMAQLGLSYDCKLFAQNNLCLSIGARTTHSRADGTLYDGAALIAAYRAQPDVRVGAWIDQNESRKSTLNVTAGNSTPMFGAFAVWNEHPQTGEGLEIKVSAAYGRKDLALTRPVSGTSERGQGNSSLSTLVAEARLGYDIRLDERTSVSPFAGLRHADLSNTGYTEGSDVFSPLALAKTRQSASSVIAGVNLYDKPEGPMGLDLSLGVEHYISTHAAQLNATGIDGLSAVQMSPVLSPNRPFASASLRHDIAKNQHLLFGLSHSKQFTHSEWVNSATVRYVIGL